MKKSRTSKKEARLFRIVQSIECNYMVYYLQSINSMGIIDLGESAIFLLVFDSDTVKAEIGGVIAPY